ncbi:MAG: ABC1 kinase family protein [Desulfohalobiaceae bacterium]
MDFNTISRITRFKDIVFILFKYGFGDIIGRLDLQDKVLPLRIRKTSTTRYTTWERIRMAIEELGPTFVKLGQLLSLRPDLIPLPLIRELSKLQDAVPAEKFSEIQEQLESSLGCSLQEVFSEFESEPMAAASLAQVHRAQLAANQEVVAVKIQRPGIRNTINTDLNILAGLARKAHERVESMQVYDLPLLVQEIRKLLQQELDFEREGRNIRLAQANFQDHPYLRLPKVYMEYSDSKLLVMELVRGKKLKDIQELPQEEKKLLARNGIQVSLKQILQDGFFHADPHPGNILVLEKASFSLLDWGMVGRLTPNTRFKLITLIEALVDKDSETVLNVLLSLSSQDHPVQKEVLHREIMDILDDFHSVPLKELNLGHLLSDLTNILQQHRIRLRSELAIMIKALVTSEGTARFLYPDLNIVAEAEPFVRELALQKYAPKNLWRYVKHNLSNIWQMQQEFPGQINQILTKMERGELSIGFEHKKLEGLRQTLSHIANRITLGLITAAMIISSSMIITTGVEPLLFGYPALGLVGYLLSACVAIWVIIDILRRRKM